MNTNETTDTAYTDPRDPSFPHTGEMLVWRLHGVTHYSRLYAPTHEALSWDKPRLSGEGEALAMGTRYGGFCYLEVRRTGRKVTKATGSDLYGLRAQVTMGICPGLEEGDRSVVSAWIVPAPQ